MTRRCALYLVEPPLSVFCKAVISHFPLVLTIIIVVISFRTGTASPVG